MGQGLVADGSVALSVLSDWSGRDYSDHRESAYVSLFECCMVLPPSATAVYAPVERQRRTGARQVAGSHRLLSSVHMGRGCCRRITFSTNNPIRQDLLLSSRTV